MRILIMGSNGQLGSDMVKLCGQKGHDAHGVDVPDIDIRSKDSVSHAVQSVLPELIINCAAYTAVDACESNTDAAFAVNADGVAHLACVAREAGIGMVHFSTDYVFDGAKGRPYIETDATNPLSVYGASKLAGEQRLQEILDKCYIFRISWLYGAGGSNFVKTIRRAAAEKKAAGEPLKVVADQKGTPTYTIDICRQVLAVIGHEQFGLYHCTSEGECSWYDFACHILNASGTDVDIVPCKTADYPVAAPRPLYSVLENMRLKECDFHCMRPWQEGFGDFLRDESCAGNR
jgi:dTDP-4-dehydrorhamnose reductase